MNLVGNDVVDLAEPAIDGSHLRPRFVARVCAPSELARVEAASSPKTLLWSLFAAKEAAFKVLSKSFAVPLVFAHRRFVVDEGLCTVSYGEVVVRVVVSGCEGAWVHALAWLGGARPEGGVVEVGGEDAGVVARRALLGRLGGGVEVVREPRPGSWTGLGPPKVMRAGRALPIDVSLSHDGRFAAFALH